MSNFERVAILIVEDNLQVRNLLASVAQQLGIGIILRANDGMQAIEILKMTQSNPAKVGVSQIDLVIADWEMSPVDGGTLLRWVRKHKESPDRFIPFFMISGYSDEHRVQTARDLGASEFLAKPFRVDDIISHLEGAVRDKRQYIRCDEYFGPDRRRRSIPVEMDRRGESDVPVKVFDPPRRLLTKVGGEGGFDPANVAAAFQELEKWDKNFSEWVWEFLDQLDEKCKEAQVVGDFRARARHAHDIAKVAHELRGQGGVFGYPLISTVAKSLFNLTEKIRGVPEDGMVLIRSHVEVLKAVVREDIRGDGGPLGMALIEDLKKANGKFAQKPENKNLAGKEFLKQVALAVAK